MRYIFIAGIILLSITGFSQDCKETLLTKPGTWKETSAVTRGILPSDLTKEKNTMAAINNMIKSKYSVVALNALVNSAYEPPLPNQPVNSYIYNIIPLEYYCDGNTAKPVHETSTNFYIGVNYFSASIFDTATGDRLSLEGFNVLPQLPKSKDGYWYFEEKEALLPFSVKGKTASWLITYDGKLPWSYVTKKEFLEKRKPALSNMMAEDVRHIKDVLKSNETAKEYAEKQYKNDKAKLDNFMKMEYQSIKERYEKQLSEVESKFKPAFKKIDDQLKGPADKLNEMAIVKMDPHDYMSYLFTTEDDPMGRILIKPNPGYFNKKLPRSVPQFISIDIIGNHNDPVVGKFMKDIINAIDFSKLKNMIGK